MRKTADAMFVGAHGTGHNRKGPSAWVTGGTLNAAVMPLVDEIYQPGTKTYIHGICHGRMIGANSMGTGFLLPAGTDDISVPFVAAHERVRKRLNIPSLAEELQATGSELAGPYNLLRKSTLPPVVPQPGLSIQSSTSVTPAITVDNSWYNLVFNES
jgi:hypothetical protein